MSTRLSLGAGVPFCLTVLWIEEELALQRRLSWCPPAPASPLLSEEVLVDELSLSQSLSLLSRLASEYLERPRLRPVVV